MPAQPLSEEQQADASRLKKFFRLWQARRNDAGQDWSQDYASDQLGFNQSALSQYLNGRIPLNLEAASKFSRLMEEPIESFSPSLAAQIAELAVSTRPSSEGSGQRALENVVQVSDDTPPPGYVRLEHLSPRPSMGPGTHVDEPVQIVRHLDVLETWVRKKIGTTNPERIKILTGNGHSMKPTIQDEDLVFVDMGQRSIDAPGIYVIDVYSRLLLKKALIQSDGTLILRSDNVDDYPDEERIDLRKASECINVAGRVLAWWTMRH